MVIKGWIFIEELSVAAARVFIHRAAPALRWLTTACWIAAAFNTFEKLALRFSRLLFYCCGEAGKISDLITTGTEPEDGIKVPISIKSKSLSAMPSMEITGFCIFSSS